MNILLLSTHLNLGGIGIYVFLLAKGLAKDGHRVYVASSGGDLVSALERDGISHYTIDVKTRSEVNPKLCQAFFRLKDYVKENRIEIVHAHTRVTQVLGWAIAKCSGAAYVSTCHGFFKTRLFRRLLPCWGDHCIAISEAVREHLVNDFRVKKERVTIVHNGIEIERFDPDKFSRQQREDFKKEMGLNSALPTIGTIARLSSVKGQQYLIAAMKTVLAEQEAQLLLVGSGPEGKRLADQAQELGISTKVIFRPAAFETTVPLSCIDIFVFPSLLEGLGLAIIEAQAMGVPVVASDVGGVYTLVKDGVNGLLVRPKDPLSLAEAILKLLKDPQLAKRLGRQGRTQAVERFALRQMINGIEEVYEKVSKR